MKVPIPSVIKMLLKLFFALGIIIWLLQSGKLDLGLVPLSLGQGYNWIACLFLIFLQDAGSVFRWKWILQINAEKPLPYLPVAKITWIGLFFNSFLPGAVTGDFIKLVYARKLSPQHSKTFLIASIFMDRFLGLVGLLFISGFFSIIYYPQIIKLGPDMQKLIHFNFLLFGILSLTILIFFIPQKMQDLILGFFSKTPFLGQKIVFLVDQIRPIIKHKKIVLYGFLLSVGLQFMNISAFYMISYPFYENPLPFAYVFTFIPLGFISTAVPISPSGLGVGHVVFDRLFTLANISGGASFFNLYFLVLIFVNAFGIFPYLLTDKKTYFKEEGSA